MTGHINDQQGRCCEAGDEIPEYPFWQCDGPEWAFGATEERYLSMDKYAAHQLHARLPTAAAADELIRTGAIVNSRWEGKLLSGLDPTQVHRTISALIRSFAVSHEIKQATVSTALYRWFPGPSAHTTEARNV